MGPSLSDLHFADWSFTSWAWLLLSLKDLQGSKVITVISAIEITFTLT